MAKHQDLSSPYAIHPFAYSSNADPANDGSIDTTPYKAWINTGSSNLLKVRNAADSAWEDVSVAGAATTPAFGSNSASVTTYNDNAGTLAAANAHHHIGVTSLAHTSNTFSGPITLTTSGTIGITVPTAGTINISSAGGAGGGGGNYSGVLWSSGTSMPGSPTTGQRITRTDLGLDFYYDGTRWLTTTLYTMDVAMQEIAAAAGWSTTTVVRVAHPHPTMSIWLEDFWAGTYVITTSSGTQYWTLVLNGVTGASVSTVSNAANSLILETATVDQVVAASGWIQMDVTKVSTPGNLIAVASFSYRLIGT